MEEDDELTDIVKTLEVREEARCLTNKDYDAFFERKFNEYLQHAEDYQKQNHLIVDMEHGLREMVDLGYSKDCIGFYSRIYHAVIRHDMRIKDGR